MAERQIFRSCVGDRRGSALVEFAIAAPLLLTMLLGTVAYGGYFWRAHALQQAANDGARAAIGGLTTIERGTLAGDVARRELVTLGEIDADRAIIETRETADALQVTIAYDVGNDAFYRVGLVPLPDRLIRRTAVVRLGGL